MSKKTITLTLLLFFLFLIFLQIATANESNFFTLERAIEMALSNNSLILAAKEKEKAAIEEEKSARKEFLPKAKASYSYTRLMDEPYSTASGYKIIMGEKDNFKWDITLTQPIFTGFALVTKHKMAKLGIDISRVEEEQAMMDVEKRVKIAYFNILLAKKFLFVADEAVSQLEAHVRDAEKFYKQGMIAYNDLLKSKVALSHAIQQRVKAKSELKMAISSFNTLLMLDINQKSEVQDLLKERSFNFSLDTLFTQAMANRPELKALRLALKNAGLAIKLAKSSYFPKIFLIGSYEQTGDNLTATNNDYGNDHNAGVTLLMQWTFFEWGKKRNEVEKYRYKKLELLQQLRSIENSIKLEVKNAYLKLKVAEENIKTAKKSLEQARENFRITNLQYKQQMTTSTEVLDARTFLTQAETNYYSSLYGYEIAFAELERAVGKRLERSK